LRRIRTDQSVKIRFDPSNPWFLLLFLNRKMLGCLTAIPKEPKNLSMVFYLLNLLAFVSHKVLELGDRLYQQCREGESRRGLWVMLRAAFYHFAVESWEQLLLHHLNDESGGP
ncbi:MAG: hypothetical protein ACREEM_53130, partial [Blastocatellia bacterium]